ncbi:MAG: VWA domain-containing protein [Acidobacteria bacterium]|nr:VWA domain-containing protein [Acidobacteriota bacterium]
MLIDSLRDEDRFELLAFASEVRSIVSGPAAATATCRREAVAELRKLKAGGATEMTQAFVHALKPLRDGAQRQIVLLTDGYIGFEAEVIGKVMAARDAGVRVHVAGIGAAPNRALTRGVSRAGAGVEVIADGEISPEVAQVAAERILRATVGPVVTGLEIAGDAVLGVAPARGVDVLSGRPAVVAVRLRPEGGTIRIRGTRPGGDIWETERRVPSRGEAADGKAARVSDLPIGALFGREAVADVEAKMAAAGRGEAAGFAAEIEALGMRHRIATARTSLVAISEEPSVDPKAPRRRERLPVELPHGVSAEGVGFAGAAGMTMAGAADTGSFVSRMAMAPEAFARRPRIPFDRMDPSTVYEVRGAYGPSTDSGRRYDRRYSLAARILRSEGSRILLEFECPDDGFELPEPGHVMAATFEDGRRFTASVEDQGTTRTGPHARGLVLRLALVAPPGSAWPATAFGLLWIRPAGPQNPDGSIDLDLYTLTITT